MRPYIFRLNIAVAPILVLLSQATVSPMPVSQYIPSNHQLAGFMLFSTVLILAAEPALAISNFAFLPRAPHNGIVRRDCMSAAPNSNLTAIVDRVCNDSPQNDLHTCINQITTYVGQSVAASCTHYFQLYENCLAVNHTDANCTDAKLGYQDCSIYALQTYAYCSCYTSVPAALYSCATDELKANSQDNSATATMPGSWTIPPTLLIPEASLPPSTALPLRIEVQPGASAAFPSSFAAASSVSPADPDDPIPTLLAGESAIGTPTMVIDTVKMATWTSSSSGSDTTDPSSEEEETIGTRTSVSTITSTGVTMVTSCAPTVTSCPPVFAYFTTTFATTLLYCGDGNGTICASSPSSTAAVGAAASSSYLPASPTTVGLSMNTSDTAAAATLTPVPSPPENDLAVETISIASGGDESCGRGVRKRAVMMVW